MIEVPQNPLILVVVGVGALLAALWAVRLWREQQYNLSGKTVLITGGSRGLGLVMARYLVTAGAHVAICARDAAELERARAELEQRSGQVLTVSCDVTDKAQVEQMVRSVRDHFGQIDILINNAGVIQVAPMELMTLEDYDEAMKVHFWAPLYTTLAVLPEMRQRHAGRIVNISSIGGKVSSPHLLPYSASKFALVGLSEGMRAELAKDGIVVTTVCPGLMRTGSPQNAFFKGKHREEYTWFSISDSLPFTSISAESAARQIIAACKRGDAEVVLSLPAQIGDKFHALFPGLTADLLSWLNRFLPEADGIGSDRAKGKDSYSSLSPSLLTTLSDRAAQQNNEIVAAEPDSNRLNAQDEKTPGIAEIQQQQAEQESVRIQVVQKSQAPTEVKACLEDIQNTMGIPWPPANWRAYAMYPEVMQLFWQRLQPAVATESFLRNSIAISERAYLNINSWYQPGYQADLVEAERRHIQRELNAFTFGNPQLLIQQVALSRALQGEVVGQDIRVEPRHGSSPYRHPEIQMLDEQAVQGISEEMQHVYRDIQRTLGLPLVNSDHQALAKWPTFFLAAWEDVKQWRQRQEYRTLEQELMQLADDAANRLCPPVLVGEREVRDLLNDPGDLENLQQMVQTFTQLLPGLILNVAMFHLALASGQPVRASHNS
jgi:NAD(P)-dependent dehydrogenase (short-subunit alcohol dehydrogenase family)